MLCLIKEFCSKLSVSIVTLSVRFRWVEADFCDKCRIGNCKKVCRLLVSLALLYNCQTKWERERERAVRCFVDCTDDLSIQWHSPCCLHLRKEDIIEYILSIHLQLKEHLPLIFKEIWRSFPPILMKSRSHLNGPTFILRINSLEVWGLMNSLTEILWRIFILMPCISLQLSFLQSYR